MRVTHRFEIHDDSWLYNTSERTYIREVQKVQILVVVS